MEKSKVINKITSVLLLIVLLSINLFFVYKIVYHKTDKQIIIEHRDKIADNIEKFKTVDKKIDNKLSSVTSSESQQQREAKVKEIEAIIEEQKSISIKVENLSQNSAFKKAIFDISGLMKSEIRINTHIISKIIENKLDEVQSSMEKKKEIIHSIDLSYDGLNSEIERKVNPIERVDVKAKERSNVILGQWKDDINDIVYYFNSDNQVHIIKGEDTIKNEYTFIGYKDGVYKIKINSIEKEIILNFNSREAKVKTVNGDKKVLEYWSYINSVQEPK